MDRLPPEKTTPESLPLTITNLPTNEESILDSPRLERNNASNHDADHPSSRFSSRKPTPGDKHTVLIRRDLEVIHPDENIIDVSTTYDRARRSMEAREQSRREVEEKNERSRREIEEKHERSLAQDLGVEGRLFSPVRPSRRLDSSDNRRREEEDRKFKQTNFWKGCCGRVMDRRAVFYMTQVGIGFVIISFAMYKLTNPIEQHRCTGEDPSPYISLITLILGWFCPSPNI